MYELQSHHIIGSSHFHISQLAVLVPTERRDKNRNLVDLYLKIQKEETYSSYLVPKVCSPSREDVRCGLRPNFVGGP